MTQPSRQQYLESKVMTASQPQLHLMLLEGSLRFGTKAKEAWMDGADFAEVDLSLQRMFDIVEELLQGVASGEGEISSQLEEQYAFIYRELAACRVNEDRKRLESSLDLLSYQRETWKLANQRIDTQPATPKPSAMPYLSTDTGVTTPGFSFEA